MIGFGFCFALVEKVANQSQSIENRNQSKTAVTFETQLKILLAYWLRVTLKNKIGNYKTIQKTLPAMLFDDVITGCLTGSIVIEKVRLIVRQLKQGN